MIGGYGGWVLTGGSYGEWGMQHGHRQRGVSSPPYCSHHFGLQNGKEGGVRRSVSLPEIFGPGINP